MPLIGKKTLWQGRFLRAVLIDYTNDEAVKGTKGGVCRQWEAFERVGCSGVVGIVPLTREGEVVLIRQFRPPINAHVIELPAGLCDIGEFPEEAAKRELIEETGYSAGHLRFLTDGPLSSGASAEILLVYLATGLDYVGIDGRDETEEIEVLKVPIERLAETLRSFRASGDYVDLKVYGLIELALAALKSEGI